MADKIDSIINTSVATLVGIIMLCSVVIPIALTQINAMPEGASEFVTILKVVIYMAVVGLLVGVVRYFSNSKE